jgi:hypothetical protein
LEKLTLYDQFGDINEKSTGNLRNNFGIDGAISTKQMAGVKATDSNSWKWKVEDKDSFSFEYIQQKQKNDPLTVARKVINGLIPTRLVVS